MFRNYLTSVLRYVSKNKAFTVINILGLATGITACILITGFVLHEFSYDNFHVHKDRIFRLQLDRYNQGEITTRWAAGAMGIGPDVKANFAEVEDYVRLTGTNALFSHGDIFFKEDGVYFATPSFFRVFSVPLVRGDSMALNGPFKVVLSESLARKYFGNSDPIGKVITNNGNVDYEVTGVFQDLPVNTHMKISALFSYASFESLVNNPEAMRSWHWDGHFTYVLLREHVNAVEFGKKLAVFTADHEAEEVRRAGAGMVFNLQRLTDIHLDSDFMYEFKSNGDRASAYFLSIVALLLLLIAWINYVNLSTAKSIERAREVGVRKVLGGHRRQLTGQFLLEAVLFNFAAVVLAVVFAIILTPWFSELSGRPLGYSLFKESVFWLCAVGLTLAGGLFSGLYPAFILSGFRPVEVLKGRFKNSTWGVVFRKGMVVIQFMASITLIVGTFTVYRQITFMKDQALGVDIHQTVVLHAPEVADSLYEHKFLAFKQQILQYPEVSSVTAATSVPGRQPGWNAGGIRRLSQSEDESNQYRVIMMDHDFVTTFGLNVVAGRSFSGSLSQEHRNVLINESAASLMGFDSPEQAISDQIFFWGDTFRIVGVLRNYHQESLKKSYEPLVFRYSNSPEGFYAIKFNTSQVKSSLARFEARWKEVFPGNPFVHFFLDEHYNEQYQADQQFGKVFAVFSMLAIFIACLGLFGLSSLTAIQRTKEIGVRKVMGATIHNILGLVSRDYLVLLSLSIALSIPLAWWIMRDWLQAFAYRITLSWWIFALPCALVVVIALLTVSVHTLRAARVNPATSLRYE